MIPYAVNKGSKPVRNICRIPNFLGGAPQLGGTWATFGSANADYTGALDAADTPLPGLPSYAMTATTTGPLSRKTYTPFVTLLTGMKIFGAIWVKCTQAVSVGLYWEGSNPDGSYVGGPMTGTVTLVPNQWTRVAGVYTVPSIKTNAIFKSFGLLMNGGSGTQTPTLNAGDVVKYASLMCLPDVSIDPAIHLDGTTPGWRWSGAAGLSESVGYPYSLESIAGKPLFFAENIVASTTNHYRFTDARPFTVITVAKVPGGASTPGFWEVRTGVTLRRAVAVSAGIRYGLQRTDGTYLEQTIPTATVDPTAFHILASRITPTGIDSIVDGVVYPLVDDAVAPAAQPLAADSVLRIGSRDNIVQADAPTTAATVLYSDTLNDETVKRVTGWLARRYGLTVPAGY